MRSFSSRWLAMLLALALLLNAGAACAEAQTAPQAEEPFGSPWVNPIIRGNLPAEAPSLKDDFYLAINYDVLAAHQDGEDYDPVSLSTDMQDSVIGMIHDESVTGSGIETLRIFWEQASDLKTLSEEGLAGVNRYTEKIMAAGSLQELNSVLLADDFPFSPYIVTSIMPESMRSIQIVCIGPAMALADSAMMESDAYAKPVSTYDEFRVATRTMNLAKCAKGSLQMLGVDPAELEEQVVFLFNTEASYIGKVPGEEVQLNAPYGSMGDFQTILEAEELAGICTSFPLVATLKKFGKDASPRFLTVNTEWLKALDELWQEENLDTLKRLTAYKVMMECSGYITQDVYNKFRETPLIGEGNAWNACDRATTFGSLLAQLYAERGLGSEIREKLTEVTHALQDEFRKMFRESEWISEETRADAIEKVDRMALNILGPEDGYLDFTGLQLKTGAEGATLLDNYLAVKAYRNELDNRLIGLQADGSAFWRAANPSEINCFYEPFTNSINILPGFIIDGTNWWDGITDSEIMGGIGTVIGHEMGHGFDFSGSQNNAYGETTAILHEDDLQEFLDRVQKIVDTFNAITVVPDMPTDGSNLKVENAADLVGLYAALKVAASKEDANLEAFFRAAPRLYALVTDLENFKMRYMPDVHAPGYLRVNVNFRMMPEFYETFGITEGDGMYLKPEDRLSIWWK